MSNMGCDRTAQGRREEEEEEEEEEVKEEVVVVKEEQGATYPPIRSRVTLFDATSRASPRVHPPSRALAAGAG